ncbi:LacI family DNA-binding transcriptional regulator [Pseudonocardia sp. TRM90224]|uniref:LacI family DNA-binding transcriptional regulator n=1 Tax=Pseudonocardia sp. TRM90224 TaxID=2812678 RepID=UPI001E342977|nr:LacI family DNA-binding transcriptional regulator [Pseudonocardia sp. TRM90224]
MATIHDVAARAGVSAATVSRVFAGSGVSQDKVRVVLAAAEEMGYTPNRTARALRLQTSTVIALIVVDIENPFFTSLARGVEDVTRAAGYSLVLCNSDDDPVREGSYLDVAVSERMAGVILVPTSDRCDLSRLADRRTAIVTVDRALHSHPVDAVVVDNVAGGRSATARLYERGASRVACITGPRDADTAELRSAGWRQEFRRFSPTADPDAYLEHADYRVDGGRAAMARLLDAAEPPDAVFVANNLMAVGALAELRSRGLAPPSFGMAAYGDLPYMPLGPSGVDVIPMPTRLIGATAATVLLERIKGSADPLRTVVLRNESD